MKHKCQIKVGYALEFKSTRRADYGEIKGNCTGNHIIIQHVRNAIKNADDMRADLRETAWSQSHYQIEENDTHN